MRFCLLLTLLLTGLLSNAQSLLSKVDTSNYYDYFVTYDSPKQLKGEQLSTNWLRENDIVPILMEELNNAGHKWLYDNALFKIDSGQYIVISAYSRKSNFGFLYMEGHDLFPSKNHRQELTQMGRHGVDYISCEETPSGNANFVKIKKLPDNVFVLSENCYWYQFTDNPRDNASLVTKEIALKILRQDIKKYLAKAPKPI